MDPHSRGLFWAAGLCLSSLQGLTRVRNATDAVGIVLKELKNQSCLGAFHLLVAVDGVNALWGRTSLKREDKSLVGKPSLSCHSDLWHRRVWRLDIAS